MAFLTRRWIFAAYGLLALIFCGPILVAPNNLGGLDWDQHLFYYASVLKNVVEYGQMPYWNPWYCGGNVLWQNPQVPLLSPVFPLTAIVSLPLAMKLNIVLHYWIGLVGMHLLLTEGLGLVFLPAVALLASVAVCGGGMAMHLAVGHSVFLPCLYLPLQLHFFLRGVRTGALRDLALGGALLALMIYNGALHVVPMSVGALGVLGLIATICRRDWRPLAAAVLLTVLGFAYAAPKLWPVTAWVQSERFMDVRTVLERPDAMTGEMVLRTYLDRYQNRGLRFGGQRSGWYEYGNYIGTAAALLIAASLVFPLLVRGTRERWLGISLAVTTALLLLLSAGEFSWWAPGSLANYLPLFSSFRIPSRYTIVFVLFGTAGAAWMLREAGIDRMTPAGRTLVGWLCVLAIIDIVVTNRQQLRGTWTLAPLEQTFAFGGGVNMLTVDPETNPYGPDSPMLRSLMRSHTFYNCYESLQTKRVATPDEPLVGVSGGARVSDVVFTPNRVEFSVASGPVMSEISLNQNLSDGWRSDAGAVVPSLERQRPAVRLAPGENGRFAFTFRPPGLIAGLLTMLVALGATVVGWRWRISPPVGRIRSGAPGQN